MALRRVQAGALAFAYREWNADAAGEPVVLLHGITGSSADWEATAREMHGRRLIAFDARGHGESDWDTEAAYAGDNHFADVVQVLDALGIERCVLAGFSMGGNIAVMVAAALPDRVSRVVIVDNYPDPAMTEGSRRVASRIAAYADEGAWFDPAIAQHFRDDLAAGRESRLDLWSMWEALTLPVLLVRGGLSDVLPAGVAAEMLRRQPLARLVTIPGVAHPVPFARPRELATAIEAFLAEHEV